MSGKRFSIAQAGQPDPERWQQKTSKVTLTLEVFALQEFEFTLTGILFLAYCLRQIHTQLPILFIAE